MAYKIEAGVDKNHSIDPSYIVHYRVTDNGHLIGDGTLEYNRQAIHNDIPISENIPATVRKHVQEKIVAVAQNYINQHRP